MSQVIIYGDQRSNFVRSVELVCRLKEIDYQIGYKNQQQEIEWKSAAHFRLHPFGRMPILFEQDFVLAESLAICRYLAKKSQGEVLLDTDPKQQAKQDMWATLAVGDIDRAIIRRYLLEFVNMHGLVENPNLSRMASRKPDAEQAVKVVEHQLTQQGFIASEYFSIADALLVPTLQYATRLPTELSLITPDSAIHPYIEKVRALSSFSEVLI
ncbi:glutathione S-transferase family protein [Motilimonas sp. 1_MG-2023]|uniref:glutathione S-transferase family protein n=1 Tax=Motilimonas sp. 1_MG-2023 TaxID=3062672 RepID=UPI0026E3438C|nr:glutathione S-transferase family protein [Motilimonas sp. 1_MG-2023]MDO6525992.1 glutathione S-transferase family protein [Motilimonas sp. 1_MG-2023]